MYVPQVGNTLTITLPGEVLRAVIQKVVTPNSVIAQIISQPMAKSHSYAKDGIIACRRQKTMFGEQWEVVEERKVPVEELVKQEEENAAITRKKQCGTQHIGNDEKRIPSKASNSSKPKQRKKASKNK